MTDYLDRLLDILVEASGDGFATIAVDITRHGEERTVEYFVHHDDVCERFSNLFQLDKYVKNLKPLTVDEVLESWGIHE